MRTIKFRAWDKEQKEIRTLQSNWSLSVLNDEKNYVVMQYTGLLDKNGKEIYEGDLLIISDNPKSPIFKVFWSQKQVKFALMFRNIWEKSSKPVLFKSFGSKPVEVIGNIYEHEHLLKDNGSDKIGK